MTELTEPRVQQSRCCLMYSYNITGAIWSNQEAVEDFSTAAQSKADSLKHDNKVCIAGEGDGKKNMGRSASGFMREV